MHVLDWGMIDVSVGHSQPGEVDRSERFIYGNCKLDADKHLHGEWQGLLGVRLQP